MTASRKPQGALRAFADFAGAALLRRRSIRTCLNNRNLIPPLIVLFAATCLQLAFALASPGSLVWFVLLPAGTLLHSLFWLIAAATVLEPITTLLLGLAEDDPLLLYWAQERRPQTRAAFLIALPAGLMLRALLTPWLGLLGDLIAFVYGFLLLARTLAVGWRFNTMTALVLAAAPVLLILALAAALTEPVVAATTALIFIPLLWAATSDIRAQFRMDAAAEKLIAREKIAHEELTGLVRDVIRLRAAGAAGRLVEAEGPPLATAQRIALLTAAGRHLEAVDLGSKAIEAGESSAALHLAMAEACLRTDDPEDAAAHAEEAYDLGGDPQALVLLAVASFGMGERESGTAACMRVLALEHGDRAAKLAARQAKSLLRFAESSDFQPDQ